MSCWLGWCQPASDVSAAVAQARFQVLVPGATGALDEFGVWETASSPVQADADVGGLPRTDQHAEAPVWLIDLPPDRDLARHIIELKKRQLAAAELAVPEASRRLRDFVRQSTVDDPQSFATGASALGQTQAERNLAEWVSVLGSADTGAEASFGAFDRLPAGWRETADRVLNLLVRVRDSLLYFARVQSTSAGRRLASTDVGWNGHFRTMWNAPLSTDAGEQHAENLGLVLRTRAAWLRMALLIARGSVQLGLLLPANPVLGLPAAWRFFNDVLRLARELNQQSSPANSIPT